MRFLYKFSCAHPTIGMIIIAAYLVVCMSLLDWFYGGIMWLGSVYAWMCWQSNKDNGAD